MKKNKLMPRFILACALMLGLVLSSAPLWAEAADVSAEVASVRGTVSVKRAASEKTFSAFVGLKLKQGDVVTVAAGGEVVINIGADKTVKGLSDSSFKISNLTGTDADSQAGFTLIKGTVFNEVRSPQSSNEGLTVRTGNTVAGVRGTTYTVSLRATDGFTVRTLEGSVFLDTVLARVEADTNASLVTEQQTVGAGEGAGTGREGTYELSMEDFTRAELEYITQHPEDFPQDMVSEAQKLLDDWVDTTPAPTEEQKQIVYEDIPATESSGGGGDGGGSTSVAYYTVNFVNSTANGNFSEFHTPTGSIQVAAGSQLPAGLPHAGRLGYSFEGWYTDDTGSNFTSPPLTGALRYEPDNSPPINSNLTLYPYFVLDSSSFGAGTLGNPYIVNGDNFPHFSQYVHTATGLAAHYKLAGNIFCDDYDGSYGSWSWNWAPIGDQANPFTGSFDGDGHTISEFNSINAGGLDRLGFFGSIDSATIENLTVQGSISTAFPITDYFGGIVGYMNGGTIDNCENKVTVNATGLRYVGGVVGGLMAGSITNCKNSVNIDGINTVGGIAGTTSSGTISGCQNTGSITSIAYAGGIVGEAGGVSITNCSSNANIAAENNSTDAYAGGIAGDLSSSTTVAYCDATGSVSANGSTAIAYAGGIAGGDSNASNINNCYAANMHIYAYSTNLHYIGGIVGRISYSLSEVERCYVDYIELHVDSGSGTPYVGGIAGAFANYSLSFCATLNVRVQDSGGTPLILGRITSSAGTFSNNYALYESGAMGFHDGTDYISGSSPTDKNGNDITSTNMTDPSWWAGLGFNSTNGWNTSTPPTLRNMP